MCGLGYVHTLYVVLVVLTDDLSKVYDVRSATNRDLYRVRDVTVSWH